MPRTNRSILDKYSQYKEGDAAYVARGPLSCRACFTDLYWETCWPEDLPLQVFCIRSDPQTACCDFCHGTPHECQPLPVMLQFDATRVDELLDWSFHLFNPMLANHYDFDRSVVLDDRGEVAFYWLIYAHCKALGGVRFDAKNAAYQTQVFQRKTLAQQAIQPIPSNADPALRASYARSTALRAQPCDDGYADWVLAVRAFMAKLEKSVVDEYDQAKWDAWRRLLPNEDVLEFYEG
ncbi:hypothetical protein ANO14919_022770 [Xylariales sp. No.14919]|nr:hypothetical protein ANO14919_022770 [Xylariales sp. No.14919]